MPATQAHAHALAPLLRAEDRAELEASHGIAPLDALLLGVECSHVAFAIVSDEGVLAIFGVATIESHQSVWMLTGSLVERRPLSFLRVCKRELSKLLARWPLLLNLVDARNARSLRWVERLGFRVMDAVPFGVSNLPFHPIYIQRTTCAS